MNTANITIKVNKNWTSKVVINKGEPLKSIVYDIPDKILLNY